MARNPARYLSKYLSKETGVIAGCDYEGHPDALPRQWQSRSEPMRRMVEFYTGRLPASFADFLQREWQVLEGLGLGFVNFWHPPSCDRYEVLTFYPSSFESLMLVWERYVASLPPEVAAPRPDPSNEELLRVPRSWPVEVHQEGGEPVVSNGIRPFENLIAPNTKQLDLI